MAGRSGKSNVKDLEVVQTLVAQVQRLRGELQEARSTIREQSEAAEVGAYVMTRFRSREDFDQAFSADPGTIQPGVSPMTDLAAWRRSQLGL